MKFDTILVENLSYIVPYALAERYNATLIGMTSLPIFPPAHQALGNPAHPIAQPGTFDVFPEHPGILDRIHMLYHFWDFSQWNWEMYENQADLVARFFPEVKVSVHELARRVDFAIECVSPAQGFIRPLMPNTRQIGIIHIQPPKPQPACQTCRGT